MVHELFNEDLGVLPRQLKGPYGLQQLLAVSTDRMRRSQLKAIVTIAPLYGSYTIKCSKNMQSTHIQKSGHHQILLFNCFSPLCCRICLMDASSYLPSYTIIYILIFSPQYIAVRWTLWLLNIKGTMTIVISI